MLTPGSASVDHGLFCGFASASPAAEPFGASEGAIPAARPATLSIVLLVHNQRATVRDLVARLRRVDVGPLTRELILVDEGSDDGTGEVLAALDGQDDVRTVGPPPVQAESPGTAAPRRVRNTGEAVGAFAPPPAT